MDEKLEKVTAHRASQAPWISKHTSHLKNILQTKKRRKKKFSVAHSIKIKRLEKEIEAACQEDLRIYEETVFELGILVESKNICRAYAKARPC